MKKSFLLLSLFIFSLCASGLAQQTPSLANDDIEKPATTASKKEIPVEKPANKPSTAISTWKEFSFADGHFATLLPNQPAAQKQTINVPVLGDMTINLLTSTSEKNILVLGYGNFPASDSLDVESDSFRLGYLNGSIQSITKELKGELVNKTNIVVAGGKGVEFTINSPMGTAIGRALVIGKSVYNLLAVSPTGATGSEEAKAFLNSFKRN